jgi:hypothetical protein
MTEAERERNQPEEPGRADQIESADAIEQQDFAARNVIMSNALQGGASPAAGAVSTGEDLGMQPTTDEALADDDVLPGQERRDEE